MPTVPPNSPNPESPDGDASDRDTPVSETDLVNRAVDHAIALRESIGRIADPFLGDLADMVLFELGRRLARLEGE